jgi:Uma2 family endonuclease
MSTTTLITFAEFERLPDIPGKQELVDGELILMPPAEKRHATIAMRIAGMLWNSPVRDRARTDGTGYRIGTGWIVPDASVLWPDQPQDEKYYLHSPMIAVEILSAGENIERKLRLYFEDGAQEVWVIDPRNDTMTVYLRQSQEISRLNIDREYHSGAAQVTVLLEELFAI